MFKKTMQLVRRVLLICFVFVGLISIAISDLTAAAKKDISDPVLQEIIASFAPKMPRFVDKHGINIFVSDEAITRGAFILAIYEYDKSLKPDKNKYVSKKEFDELRNKITQIESIKGSSVTKLDIMQVINDLQPNMPVLLDGSLENSKVFSDFKKEILMTKRGVPDDLRNSVDQSQKNIEDLKRKISTLEKTSATNLFSQKDFNEISAKVALLEKGNSGSKTSSNEIPETVKKDISKLEKELEKLSYKLDNIEISSLREGKNVTAANIVTKTEFNSISKKISALEKNISDSQSSTSAVPETVKKDISKLEKELEKLSYKLDNIEISSLREGKNVPAANIVTKTEFNSISKKISALEKNISASQPSTSAVPETVKNDISKLEKELEKLSYKLDNLEIPSSASRENIDTGKLVTKKEFDKMRSEVNDLSMYKSSANIVTKENDQLRKELVVLSKRVSEIERVPYRDGQGSEGIKQYTSAFTKISLGLSMVAAFFIAR